MTIEIKCDVCRNVARFSVNPKKCLQFRDNLEVQSFHYDDATIRNDKLQEIRISCSKCKNYIYLSFD